MNLQRKFETGEFAILAEIEPPKGADVSEMVANAKRVKGDVDAFVVPEMSNAVMRMSSLGGAMILQQEGLETVFQVCCRDRNRLALQADLLAAGATGIPNVMAVVGEDPSFGDHHQARAVNDIDLIELLGVIHNLEQGRDMAGIELTGAPQFLVGTTANAGAPGISVELEAEEMMRRADAGAGFFITPPLFDASLLKSFLTRIDSKKITVIPTVLLLKSLGMARYISRNMDHVHVPDTLIKRIQSVPDKAREGIKIAAELVSELKTEGYQGVLLSTVGWEHRLPEIIEGI
ncbi:MAG: 5,10-methylenetetrahydrofolate reductase [Deltaproteobacteria bacterium]|nr:MAG: 5,10-methylenetetrahydrofolate reductase [Deltaproteobacteria bacterium]